MLKQEMEGGKEQSLFFSKPQNEFSCKYEVPQWSPETHLLPVHADNWISDAGEPKSFITLQLQSKDWWPLSCFPLEPSQWFWIISHLFTPFCLKDFWVIISDWLKYPMQSICLTPSPMRYWARDFSVLDFGVNSVEGQSQAWREECVSVSFLLVLKSVVF